VHESGSYFCGGTKVTLCMQEKFLFWKYQDYTVHARGISSCRGTNFTLCIQGEVPLLEVPRVHCACKGKLLLWSYQGYTVHAGEVLLEVPRLHCACKDKFLFWEYKGYTVHVRGSSTCADTKGCSVRKFCVLELPIFP